MKYKADLTNALTRNRIYNYKTKQKNGGSLQGYMIKIWRIVEKEK